MSKIITIIDYNSGNLRSVFNAFNLINDQNYKIQISTDPNDLKKSDKIILPGVGSFPDCINSLSKTDQMIDILKEQILVKKKDFLGICVGMQLLADYGYEYKKTKGLAIISGNIVKIKKYKSLKIPHIGWNEIEITKNHKILKNINNKEHFYFVHSYHFMVKNPSNIIAKVNYGNHLTSIIAQDNIVATQFHPEKSGEAGLKLLKNFIS